MDDYDDDGPSAFRMMGLFGMMAPAMAMMVAASLWGVVILYVIARWRLHRAGTDDPQLGLKFVVHLFRFHGYQILLLGTFLLLYSVLIKGNDNVRSPMWRSALGFLVAGGGIFGVHTLILGRTNQEQHPLVARLFTGMSLVVTGMIAMIALIAGLQALFAKGDMGNEGRAFWSLVLVYVTAWAVQGSILARNHLTPTTPYDGSLPPPPPPGATVPDPMRQPLA